MLDLRQAGITSAAQQQHLVGMAQAESGPRRVAVVGGEIDRLALRLDLIDMACERVVVLPNRMGRIGAETIGDVIG